MTEAERIIEGAKAREVVHLRVAGDQLTLRAEAHNAVMNRLNGIVGSTSWALVATDDEYELLAARLGVLE